MSNIALEMERLRNPYSGLGQYCLHLGQAFAAEPSAADLGFECLVPKGKQGMFGKRMQYRIVNAWQRWLGVRTNAALWHCMHQDSAYLPFSRKTLVVLTIHDLNFLDRPDYSKAKKQRKLAVIQRKVNRATGLIYISEYVQNWVRQHLQVPKNVLETVIYNGGDLQPAVQSFENQQAETPFLFSIGIHPKKNYHVLMPILAAFPEYKWIIAGPDSRGYKAKIEREAERFGVTDRLEFCGPVDNVEKAGYYARCSALLFPSLSEGFGLPVIEAMSFGKPVFCSNRTSLPEIGGKEAFYFADFEADTLVDTFKKGMEQYQNDPEKPQRMKQWAARFNWENSAKAYIQFYKTLLRA